MLKQKKGEFRKFKWIYVEKRKGTTEKESWTLIYLEKFVIELK